MCSVFKKNSISTYFHNSVVAEKREADLIRSFEPMQFRTVSISHPAIQCYNYEYTALKVCEEFGKWLLKTKKRRMISYVVSFLACPVKKESSFFLWRHSTCLLQQYKFRNCKRLYNDTRPSKGLSILFRIKLE